jgi:hypothetical protein
MNSCLVSTVSGSGALSRVKILVPLSFLAVKSVSSRLPCFLRIISFQLNVDIFMQTGDDKGMNCKQAKKRALVGAVF